jgi:hypothetical protein
MSENETPEIEPPDMSSLMREFQPPPELERRTIIALASRGFIRTRPNRKLAWVWSAIVASLALFWVGFWMGGHYLPSSNNLPGYILLLAHGPHFQETSTPDEESRRVSEYRNWAADLRRHHVMISGARLGDDVRVLSMSPVPEHREQNSKVTGFFEVRVGTLEQALAIARTCPNLRYGGEVEVRPIDGV